MFVDKLLTGAHFQWVERIGLGYLGDKGILAVDGVVKGSLWGKFSVLQLIEHFGVFGILWGELLFDFLHGLCKRDGECDILDASVVCSEDLYMMFSLFSLLTEDCGVAEFFLLTGSYIPEQVSLFYYLGVVMP